jgi:hypothetical protein
LKVLTPDSRVGEKNCGVNKSSVKKLKVHDKQEDSCKMNASISILPITALI